MLNVSRRLGKLTFAAAEFVRCTTMSGARSEI